MKKIIAAAAIVPLIAIGSAIPAEAGVVKGLPTCYTVIKTNPLGHKYGGAVCRVTQKKAYRALVTCWPGIVLHGPWVKNGLSGKVCVFTGVTKVKLQWDF